MQSLFYRFNQSKLVHNKLQIQNMKIHWHKRAAAQLHQVEELNKPTAAS